MTSKNDDIEVDSDDEMDVDGAGDGQSDTKRKVYLPKQNVNLEEGEELVVDETAYRFLHSFQSDHACLSFDHVVAEEDSNPGQVPITVHLVAGTEADEPKNNSLTLMRLSNIHPTKEDGEESSSEESEASDDEDVGPGRKAPKLHLAKIPLKSAVNRVRVCQLGAGSTVASAWLDVGKVEIWNLTPAVRAADAMAGDGRITKQTLKQQKPLSTFTGHLTEGFAMDWSPLKAGSLLTGDSRKNIHQWRMSEGGTWLVDQAPYNLHKASVEDIQWSPTEEPVFASCSADKSIRLWDTRMKPAEASMCALESAHEKDVNVISWSRHDPFLLSGGDDGVLKVWDLRLIRSSPNPVARFKHHSAPITSVQWCPHDSTVFATTGEDNQLTLWDLAVERDQDAEKVDDTSNAAELAAVPPQLLFIHQGQTEMKELRWHPRQEGLIVSTALDSFNVFRTISV